MAELSQRSNVILAALLTSISINRVQAICDDFDIPYVSEDSIDDLRVKVRNNILDLAKNGLVSAVVQPQPVEQPVIDEVVGSPEEDDYLDIPDAPIVFKKAFDFVKDTSLPNENDLLAFQVGVNSDTYQSVVQKIRAEGSNAVIQGLLMNKQISGIDSQIADRAGVGEPGVGPAAEIADADGGHGIDDASGSAGAHRSPPCRAGS